MSMLAPPFQLLEINVISAQDLAPVSKSIKAYAVAWLDPERKLTTQIDPDGHNNPTWNEKFVFRVDEEFLQAEDATIMIEIYASAWLRDVLIGTVAVQIGNLLPRSTNRKSNKVRFVALQVRRPSGRPQGILNIGVNLVDATMRSMPMYSELSGSAVEYWDINDPKKQHHQNYHQENANSTPYDSKFVTLQRSQSEKNDSTINDYTYHPNGGKSTCDYSDMGDSELGMPITTAKKGVIINANGSLCSDVGPSPSVVAAAIAKGIYPLSVPMPPRKTGNTWHADKEKIGGGDGFNSKMDRWRSMELPPAYDHLGQNNNNTNNNNNNKGGKQQKGKNGKGGRKSGLFSCFGTALGVEISITCGGGNRKKRYGGGNKPRAANASELTYDESYM